MLRLPGLFSSLSAPPELAPTGVRPCLSRPRSPSLPPSIPSFTSRPPVSPQIPPSRYVTQTLLLVCVSRVSHHPAPPALPPLPHYCPSLSQDGHSCYNLTSHPRPCFFPGQPFLLLCRSGATHSSPSSTLPLLLKYPLSSHLPPPHWITSQPHSNVLRPDLTRSP